MFIQSDMTNNLVENSFTIGNLINGEDYTFEVSHVNSCGTATNSIILRAGWKPYMCDYGSPLTSVLPRDKYPISAFAYTSYPGDDTIRCLWNSAD